MKTLLALLLLTGSAFANEPNTSLGLLSGHLMGSPQKIDDPAGAIGTGQPTWEWVDAQCSVVLTTWDDEFRVPTSGGTYDPCWMATDNTVECTSGATHRVAEAASRTIIWDGVTLRLKASTADICSH